MLKFPFNDFRPGQKEIINSVRDTIRNGEKLMIQAPTGFGKTVAVLFGALSETYNDNKRILFLTARKMHQSIIYDTVERINAASSLNIRYTGINGKNTMCLIDNNIDADIFNDFCRTMKEKNLCDFYNRTYNNGKTTEITNIAIGRDVSKPENAIEIAKQFRLCPYEISVLNAKLSKIIIANYFHVFNPFVSYPFFTKLNLRPEDTILIVDEAHNLPNMVMDINSVSISLNKLEKAYKEILMYDEELSKKVQDLISSTKTIEKPKIIDIKSLFDNEDMIKIDDIIKDQENSTRIPSSLSLKRLISVAINADESYLQYVSKDQDKIKINIVSLDPSIISGQIINQFFSSIFISGTLKPMDMFANLIGINESRKLEIGNYFPANNRLILNDITTTSKFSSREEYTTKIAENLDSILKKFKYSSIVFFSSYEFRDNVLSKMKEKDRVLVEEQHMSRSEQINLISKLYNDKKSLFCVIGGGFGESVDFKNEYVKMVIIVGVPFEPPSIKLKALQNYYQNKFGNGFEYAQVLPAMIKTLQAAGRIIRSENDKAIIVLMDYRFSSDLLSKYLPDDVIETDDLEKEIEKFEL